MRKQYIVPLTLVVLLPNLLLAQSSSSENITVMGVLVILGCLLLGAVFILGNHLIQLQAIKNNVDVDDYTSGSTKNLPEFVAEGDTYHPLKKGFDIKLKGTAPEKFLEREVSTFAIQPTDFRGIRPIPKVVVNVGDSVEAGQPLFFDKDREGINFVSPVSGEVIAINRGDKRAITEIVILKDKEQRQKTLNNVPELISENKEAVLHFLSENGGIPLIIERPFGVVPQAGSYPDRVHVSTFDSSPLAPNLNTIVASEIHAIQKGIEALSVLSEGNVHVGLDASNSSSSDLYGALTHCKKHWFQGPHPAGNVGIQIHNIKPQGLEEKIWTIDLQSLVTLGKMFTEGRYVAERVYAITGDSDHLGYVKTYTGANLADLLSISQDNDDLNNKRVVSGNVLTGKAKRLKSFVGQYDQAVTILDEGEYHEFLGWLVPQSMRPSASQTYIGGLFDDLEYDVDTNTHGEKRAFVVSGQYEKVLPMDTYPQHLFKAILTNDFERMQGLGIHELLEEDVALCEFVCTSKQDLQNILRDGLETLQSQL